MDTGGKPLDTWLRELNDWVVKFQLQTVPGVTDILSIGGHVLQYQIRVNPEALWKYELTLEDLVEAVTANNRNVGGQFLVLGQSGLSRKLPTPWDGDNGDSTLFYVITSDLRS